jgi:imidazoleglycerol-phosphate dehydratase
MLDLLARHGRLDLDGQRPGDLETGAHHTVEDTGIVLGQALDRALGDRAGITRYGHAVVPMDEARAACALDSPAGRSCLRAGAAARRHGGFDHELTEEFFRAVSSAARITLHLDVEAGTNAHHMIEAAFKAFARALRGAVAIDPTRPACPSTKGTLTLSTRSRSSTTAWATAAASRRRSSASGRARADRRPRRAARADGSSCPASARSRRRWRAARAGLDELRVARAPARRPVLGLCLGMQLLFERSSELGGAAGLGLLPGEVVALAQPRAEAPHIGWNVVRCARVAADRRAAGRCAFYHVHSFAAAPRGRPTSSAGRLRRAVRLDRRARTRLSASSSTREVLDATGSRCCATSRALRARAPA